MSVFFIKEERTIRNYADKSQKNEHAVKTKFFYIINGIFLSPHDSSPPS